MEVDTPDEPARAIRQLLGIDEREARALLVGQDPASVLRLVEELSRTFAPERLPAVVRRPIAGLEGRSILQTITERGAGPVHAALERLHSWIPEH